MVIIFSCRFTKHHSGSGALITKEAARGGGRRDVGKVCVLGFVAQLCLTLCDPTNCSPPGSSVHEDSPSKNTGVGCHALLQGIFPTQELNPGLPYCRQILYCLSHQGSPWILEWVAYPFSRGSSWPRDQTGVSCMAGRFFTSWATNKHIAK